MSSSRKLAALTLSPDKWMEKSGMSWVACEQLPTKCSPFWWLDTRVWSVFNRHCILRVLCGACVPPATLDKALPWTLPADQVFRLCSLEPENMELPVGLRAASHRTDTGLQEGREQLACVSYFIRSGWTEAAAFHQLPETWTLL